MVVCSICSQTYKDLCGNCIAIQQTCILCFTKFETDETVIRCKECHYLGHKDNFSAWLSKHGSCPVCRIDYNEQLFDEITLTNGTIKQLYLDKSSVYFKRNKIFTEFKFRHPYYNFQDVLVNDIYTKFKFDDNHLLISPPGSGKTIIGLSIAALLAVHTLVLVPNLAVVGSWKDRIEMFYDTDKSTIKLSQVYTRKTGDIKPITIITYQEILSYLDDYFRRINKIKTKYRGNRKSIVIDASSTHFISRLINNNIGFLILDEAHHLNGKLGKTISKLIKLIGEVKTLGLTATPPKREHQNFKNIFSDQKTDIPLPLMIREGVLAPYRDFALIFPSLGYLNHKVNIFESMDLTSASLIDERNEADYIRSTLNEIEFLNSKLEPYDKHTYWLSVNLSYYTQMIIDVIKFENNILRSNFRGLIILEQENVPIKSPHEYRGNGGAIGIFRSLLKCPTINILDPIYLTETSLLIDIDLAVNFIKFGENWINHHGLDIHLKLKNTKHAYSIVKGSGTDWNIDSYSRLVTHLFDEGYTKLLVGTKFLFGEGWDSQVLNTVIDMTTISDYAFVNQVKGRALRKDPKYLQKVSNIWEFAPNPLISPIMTSKYENFSQKHQNYFGIDDSGSIINGIYRLNSYFRKETISSNFYFSEQAVNIYSKAAKRQEAMTLWKVGEKLGELFYVIQFVIGFGNFSDNVNESRKSLYKNIIKLVKEALNAHDSFRGMSDIRIIFSPMDSYRKIKVKIAVPSYNDYDAILIFMDSLMVSEPQSTLGLHFRYEKLNFNYLKSILKKPNKQEKRSKYNDICLTVPWKVSLIDTKDIISNGISLDNYTIGTLQRSIRNFKPKHIMANAFHENDNIGISFLQVRIIQVIHSTYDREVNGPNAEYYSMNLEDIRSNQEFIDDSKIENMQLL